MLPLLAVRVWSALALLATIAGFLLVRPRHQGTYRPDRVRIARPTAAGTLPAWIAGVLLAVFWPLGIFVAPDYAYRWPAVPVFPAVWMVQVAGMLLAAGGGLLYFSAARALGRQMTPAIQIREGHELIRDGPYRYIRHPVYTSILFVGLGQSLLFLSVPVALLVVILFGLAVYRARSEEALLGSPEAFGATYRSYVTSTGMFLPRIGR